METSNIEVVQNSLKLILLNNYGDSLAWQDI